MIYYPEVRYCYHLNVYQSGHADSDNILSPVKDTAITKTSADLLLFGHLGTGFDEVLTET